MAKTLIGLDVSMIEASMAYNGKTIFEQMPNNLVDRSGIISPESFAQFIKNFKKDSGFAGNEFALAIPETAAYFRTISSPIMTDEQIKLNLPYEFRNFVGAEAVQYTYDYFVDAVETDENGKEISYRLAAAAGHKETINEFARAIKRAGFKLKTAIPQEVCLINLMKKTARPDKEYCLIGVGYEYTNVYMFKGSNLAGTKRIEMGCHDIDSMIAMQSNVDEFMASNFRRQNYRNCLAMEPLRETYDRIALEVMKTINFYRYEHNDTQIESAYFFSLGASNEELNRSICDHTGFSEGNIFEILPREYANEEDAARCLVSIGATL